MSPHLLTDHWSWRPDWTPERRNLWWYARFAADTGVQRLARVIQGAISPDAPIDPIPGPWLHLSLAEVGYAEDVPPPEAHECARSARRRLAGTGPMTLTVGPVSAMPGAVVLEVSAPGLDDLHDRLVATMADTLTSPPAQRRFVPHISVAYVRDRCARDDVFDRAAVRSGDVPLDATLRTELNEIALVEVVRDRRHYRWSPRHPVALR